MSKSAIRASWIALWLFMASSAMAGRSWEAAYPTKPDAELTPGQLCERPDAYRYPEKIPYCERNVKVSTKVNVIQTYDKVLGYHVGEMNRGEFKIDHYIPLCAGGSNDASNLWPQHAEIYQITDPLEEAVCKKMAQGKLSQSEAIDYIEIGKQQLERVSSILRELQSLN